MGEPARKLDDDEMQPNLRLIRGGQDSNTNDSHDDGYTDELAARRKMLNNQETNPQENNSGSIKDQEKNGSNVIKGPWENKVSEGQKANKKTKFSFFKKKGPLTAIILTLLGGGIGIGSLLSPSLLFIHLKEVMVNKFNTQLTSMDIRTNKILKSKTLGFSGCGNVINCKFSTMSEYQINRFKKAGIDIEVDETVDNLFGRKTVKTLKYDGTEISAADFKNKLDTDINFKVSVKKAYSPLFAGFADSIWNKTLFKLKLTKSGLKIEGDTPKKKLESVQDQTKNPSSLSSNINEPKIDDTETVNGVTKKKYSGLDDPNFIADKKAFDNIDVTAKTIAEGASEVTETGIKATTKAAAAKAANLVKITGIADDVCTVYTSARAVGFAAKKTRALQLAAFTMLYLTTSDQMLSGGNPRSEDVSYLATKLITESTVLDYDNNPILVNGKTLKQSATDSFGYKYAAYNEIGTMPATATQFLAGGGFAGSLIGFTSLINSTLGGSPQKTCKTLNNIFVQIGSAVAGIGAAILSGGVSFTVKAAVQIVGGIAVTALLLYLPTLLQDIIAGVLVDESTVGGQAGDAITSGAGVIMSNAAAQGGNAPLTVEQAIAYNNKTSEILAAYAEEDRLKYKPTDITNKNTFLGSIFYKITPYLSNMSSIPKAITSTTSLMFSSFSSISPITKASDGTEYTLCSDMDYVELGLAADPFCNLTYGIPVEHLDNIEPIEVINKMLNDGNIDTDGNIISNSKLDTFQKNCINRENPIGYSGQNYDEDTGDYCLIDADENNKYYYLYLIDQRIQKGMDGEDVVLASAYESGVDERIAFYDISNNTPETVAQNNIFTNISNFFKNPFGFLFNKNSEIK